MGCNGLPEYNTAYKNIYTESDIINSEKDKIYLISRDSMYNFIKIIEDSKILEIKNNADEESIKLIKIKEDNLAKSFADYQLEKNITFYDDYYKCKNIGNNNNQSENEFIIVNKEFLEKLKFKKIYESNVLINFEDNTNKKEIYFLTEERSLEIESKRCGIYRFIGDDNEENNSNKDDKDNDKKTDVNIEQTHNNLVLNINKSNYKEKYINNLNDHFDNKNKKNENEITKNDISSNHENDFNNINSSNNKENNFKSNMKEMSNIINNNNIYLNKSCHNSMNNDESIHNENDIKDIEVINSNPLLKVKKSNVSSMVNYENNQKKKNNYEISNEQSNKIKDFDENNNNNIENIQDNNNIGISKVVNLLEENINMNFIYLSKLSKYKYHPLIGLTNNGGFSYMNVVLQCLSNINLLTGYFLLRNKSFNKIKENFSITKAFSEVIYNLWDSQLNKNKKEYSPDNFKKIIITNNKLFKSNIGNDCKDLLFFLFENIHKELNTTIKKTRISQNIIYNSNNEADNKLKRFRDIYYEQNKSIITDLFYFDQANIITCLSCGAKIYNFNMNNLLIFPLEKTYLFKKSLENNFNSIDIKDCFNSYIKDETNKENIYCHSCNKYSKHALETKISSFPEILIILLNRIKQLEYNIKVKLSYTLEDLDNYMIQLDCNKNDRGINYELIGNILHNGKNGFGHFYCICKSPMDKNWYLYNDLNITKIKDPINNINGIPYLLFYQKI